MYKLFVRKPGESEFTRQRVTINPKLVKDSLIIRELENMGCEVKLEPLHDMDHLG